MAYSQAFAKPSRYGYTLAHSRRVERQVLYNDRGMPVRLTEERIRHIVEEHPVMSRLLDHIADALANPDYVVTSRRVPEVVLYYRSIGDRFICAVVAKTESDAFVLTSYPVKRVR